MNETAPLGGGAAASANEERSRPFNNLPHRSPQYPAKYRTAASHLRRTIPRLSDLTLDDSDDWRVLRELLDADIREEDRQ